MKFLLILSALLFVSETQSQTAGKAKASVPAIPPAYQVQIADLMKRMTEMESTVADLQRKIVDLDRSNRQSMETGWTTCTIETSFDGNFSATEPTRTAALNKVVENCKAKAGGNSIYCQNERANCGK